MKSEMDIKQYKHASLFYLSSITLSWVLWFYTAYLSQSDKTINLNIISIGALLGLLVPLIVSIAFIFNNDSLRSDFLGRIFNLGKVNPHYLALAFLLMPFSILSAQLISLVFGYGIEQFEFRGGYTFSSGVFPVWFLLIFAPLVEELAWHSYGTDCLRNKLSLLKTSLLFAAFWGLWHLPLSFIKDYYHSNLVESGLIYSLNFFVSLFPFVIIMNWLYYKTNRNILIPVVFHISAGFFNEIFLTHPMSKVIQTVLLILVSLYLYKTDKQFFNQQ